MASYESINDTGSVRSRNRDRQVISTRDGMSVSDSGGSPVYAAMVIGTTTGGKYNLELVGGNGPIGLEILDVVYPNPNVTLSVGQYVSVSIVSGYDPIILPGSTGGAGTTTRYVWQERPIESD